MVPPPPVNHAAAVALANRLYDLALATKTDRQPDWPQRIPWNATRDIFVDVWPRLLEVAMNGPSRRAAQWMFELHEDGAWIFYFAHRLWGQLPDQPAEEQAQRRALTALLAWTDGRIGISGEGRDGGRGWD